MIGKKVLFGLMPESAVRLFSGFSVADTSVEADLRRWDDSVQPGQGHTSSFLFIKSPLNHNSEKITAAITSKTLLVEPAASNVYPANLDSWKTPLGWFSE
jgi:hypothetical protein